MTVITLNIGGIPQQNLIFISPHLAKWIGWFSSCNFAGWEAHASLKQSIEVLLSIALKETYCEKLELIHASHWVDILSRYDLFGWLVTEKIVFCLPVCGKGVGIWLKKKSLPLFTLSLPFPFFLYPAAQGMWPKYSGLVYWTALLGHNVSCVYVQARCNSWVVSVAYTLSYFVIRGRLHRNHHLHSSGCTAVIVCWVGNIRCYTWLFPLPYHSIIWKSVQLLGCVWARPILKGHPAMYKRDFNCASSNSSPSDTEGAQAAQDTEEDDDDSKSVKSDSEEDEPSIPSTLPSR